MMKEFHVDYCIIESNLSSEYIFEKILKQRFKSQLKKKLVKLTYHASMTFKHSHHKIVSKRVVFFVMK